MQEAFLQLPAPKSTGRDLFHLPWLQQHLQSLPAIAAADVQATLCAYTARTLAQAIAQDPGICALLTLVWVGGSLGEGFEYNRDTDAPAAEFVFSRRILSSR